MLKFTPQDIRHEVGGPTFDRGEGYFEQGRVDEMTPEVIDSDYVLLNSKVSGSGNIYTQEVSLELSGTFGVDIDGICSCPVGFNCKHVVAACLCYLATADADPAPQLDANLRWLDNLKRARAKEPELPDAEFIAYILDESYRSNELKVRYVECKHKKNGELTKGRRLGHTGSVNRARSATEEDQQISRMLLAFHHVGNFSDEYGISGQLGQLCLVKMIETKRCFWQGTENPALSLGKERALTLDWQEIADEKLGLRMSIEPKAQVLNMFPPHYLDEGTWQFGPISDVNFNAKEWRLLHEAPHLARDEAKLFSESQITQVPDLPLPLPGKIDLVEIVGQTPVPCLYIETHQSFAATLHRMRFSFKYGQSEISEYPKVSVLNTMDNGRVVSIHRDLEQELRCRQKLDRTGLVEISQFSDEGWLGYRSTKVQRVDAVSTEEIDQWRVFLKETVPSLERKGWLIEIADSFSLNFVEVDKWEAHLFSSEDADNEAGTDWFNLRFDLEVRGKKYPLLPLITQILQFYDPEQLPSVISVALNNTTYLELPAERVQPICNILYELYDRSRQGASMPLDADIRLGKFDAAKLTELDQAIGTELTWRGSTTMRNLAAKLDDFKGVASVKLARGLKAELRDYQKSGVDWLQFLRTYQFNGVLADDMGLGKTVQVLAHLQIEKEKKRMDRPCLIVAPTSLMSNWRREVEQFTPNLSILVLQGINRRQQFKHISQHDLIITTYPLLVRDQETLLAEKYHYIVLDEAQVIKNHRSKAAQVVRQLNTRHRLCMTGTPMENHLGELWSQFDFLMPGFLDDSATFRKRFRTPIENHGDERQHQRLAKRIAPFLLRRRKVDVAKELPAKTEIIRSVTLGREQSALYESIRLSMEKKVRDVIAARGLARSHITILDALLKLRQTCCDPRLLSLNEATSVTSSAKLELLMEILPEMLEEGRRILLFSQFTTMLGLIEEALEERDIGYAKLTGQTRNRDAAIERFRQGDANVFLISLKAGGVGLNLTEADTVIHYDPWWNPAAENQATDRAHRIGQTKPVFVYKLITENTLEEKILEMQAKKQTLADASYELNHEGEKVQITSDDLRELFSAESEGEIDRF